MKLRITLQNKQYFEITRKKDEDLAFLAESIASKINNSTIGMNSVGLEDEDGLSRIWFFIEEVVSFAIMEVK